MHMTLRPKRSSEILTHHVATGIDVLERGWLNANQIVLWSAQEAVVIDSGYYTHVAQTIDTLRAHEANKVGYSRLINTHCHSDHMGGNAALIQAFNCECTVPQGAYKNVVPWNEAALWLTSTGQYAPPFLPHKTITAGDSFLAAGLEWQAIAAPGHDDDALMFYCPTLSVLITGDALWQSGTGFVWPTDTGQMQRALQTLDVIEALAPAIVIPGHGAPFKGVNAAINNARSKLHAFAVDRQKWARNAARSFVVFDALAQLAEHEALHEAAFASRIASLSDYEDLRARFFADQAPIEFAQSLIDGLVQSKVLHRVANSGLQTSLRY
jgi:glyoxylase-like metal-dependent hydrolase (beta-lactamase superfamily II)